MDSLVDKDDVISRQCGNSMTSTYSTAAVATASCTTHVPKVEVI